MKIAGLDLALRRLPTPFPLLHGEVRAGDWSAAALAVAETHGRLVSLWGRDERHGESGQFVISAVYALAGGTLVWLDLPLPGRQETYPGLADVYPYVIRQQRAVADLLGLHAAGETAERADARPWLAHGAWPAGYFPLRHDASGGEPGEWPPAGDYPFVAVAGDGVHEIAVGPVHAGIIEPGHFRFSVVGEKVLRLEERLGYTHKGIDQRFQALPASEGHRLAGRVSGDSTVAYAWAYCMALEAAWGLVVPPRALMLRALLLERERIANHLGDLGALGNDAAFAFGLAQFMRLKEDWLRVNKALFGHRYLMDAIVPGGVSRDLDAAGIEHLLAQCAAIDAEVRELHDIYDEHAGLQDRFLTTGRLTTEQAMALGLTGLAGRASGIARDVRLNFPAPPYTELEFTLACKSGGDVAARVAVRFDEILESLRLIRQILRRLPAGAVREEAPSMRADERPGGIGAGLIEGWRGEIFVALNLEPGNRIARCHCHDPSWQNWPVLEHAVIGNIVPDFPLINKSFNLSYSGHDR